MILFGLVYQGGCNLHVLHLFPKLKNLFTTESLDDSLQLISGFDDLIQISKIF